MQGGAALKSIKALKGIFQPVLASLMADTPVLFFILGFAIFQLGLTALGLPGWQCPVHILFHIPCPGCGLSTAMVLLLKGQCRTSLGVHPFAIVFLAGLIFMFIAITLPRYFRLKAIKGLAFIERKTGITALLLFGLLAYWIVRLIRSA
jgi:hypothetical protein